MIDDFRIRCRLVATEQGYPVHVSGCFGEISEEPDDSIPGSIIRFCEACQKEVDRKMVVYPVRQVNYAHDVDLLLRRIDELEERGQ